MIGGGLVFGCVYEGMVGKGISKISGLGGNRVVESERVYIIE